MEIGARGIDICAQATEAFTKKAALDSFWQDVAEQCYPERADFTVKKSLGEDMASKLYSSEPIIFRRDFANFLGAALRPKGRDWFAPRARSEKVNLLTTVKVWLEPRGRVTRNLLYDPKSQFSRAMVTADHDWAAFGNSVTSAEERQNRDGLRFRTWHLRDCAWRENYDGEVDTMFRRFKVKVRNLVGRERAGWSISGKVREKLERSPDENVNCLHVCMPLFDYDPKRKKKRFEWVSLYIDEDHKWVMSDKEVPEFNYIVSRWFTIDGSPYAFSPCVLASLPDARTLQTMTWSILEAGEKIVEPPLAAVSEAILGGIDIRSGGITWIDQRYDERTGEAIRPIEMGGQPQFGESLRQGIKENLNAAWYLNKLFMPQQGPQMTAEEIMRRHDEWLRVTQPIIDPAENERNGLMLDLVIRMAMRLGYWGDMEDMPRELRGEHVDVTYDNPIEDARKQSKTNAYNIVAGIVRTAAEIDKSVVSQIDHTKAFRDAVGGVAPADWLKPEDEGKEAQEEADEQETIGGAAAEVAALAQATGKMAPPKQAAA